eukprot:g769.t1
MLVLNARIEMKQLANWFTNARKRVWKPLKEGTLAMYTWGDDLVDANGRVNRIAPDTAGDTAGMIGGAGAGAGAAPATEMGTDLLLPTGTVSEQLLTDLSRLEPVSPIASNGHAAFGTSHHSNLSGGAISLHCPSSGCESSGNGSGCLPPVAHSNIALRSSRHSSSSSSSSGGGHGGGSGGGGGGRPNSIGSNGSGVAAAALAAAAAMDAMSNTNSEWPEPEPLAAPARMATAAAAPGVGKAAVSSTLQSEQSQIEMQMVGAPGGRLPLQQDARAYNHGIPFSTSANANGSGTGSVPVIRQQRNAMSAELPPVLGDGIAGERRNSLPLEMSAHTAAGSADSRRNSIFWSAAPQMANNNQPVYGGMAPKINFPAEAALDGVQHREKAARHRSPRDQDPRKSKQSRRGEQ